MLKLLVRDLDICKVGKLLGKNGIKSSITESSIIIDSDEITEEVIDKLLENATIFSVQNYHTNVQDVSVDDENSDEEKDNIVSMADAEFAQFADETRDSEEYEKNSTGFVAQSEVGNVEQELSKRKINKSEMVYRGEVYKWGSVRDKEDGEGKIKECVIIIQNDYQISVSDETIALFCTSNYEERAPIQFSFALTKETMVDHSGKRLELFDQCTMFISHIRGIDRNQLGKYLGTMKDSFMNTLQPTIDFCLGLKRSRTVNWAQLKMLSTIDMAEMFEIAESKVSNSKKTTEFLKLFNFDMSKNGMEYLKKSILIATTLGDYRLEDLASLIAKNEQIEANEVLRLVVARVKENFHFKKSPAISFIRLIDKLLRKG